MFQIVHIALHDRPADVLDRPHAYMLLTAQLTDFGGSKEVRIALLIAAEKANRGSFDGADRVSVEPLHDVGEPAGLAELAVADDVDAQLGLLADDLRYSRAQSCCARRLINFGRQRPDF